MKQRHVRFTATARGHVKREKVWWLENRIQTEVFLANSRSRIRAQRERAKGVGSIGC